MFKRFVQLMCVVTFVAGLNGCGGTPSEPPAAKMMPDLPGYKVVEGETLTGYIGKLAGGAALLAAQPELTAAALVVEQIVGCYQEVGAVQARVYSNEETPLSAGAVAIADRNALNDPMNLFKCVAPMVLDAAGADGAALEIKPCTASYTLARDDNEFYIVYVGTTEEICHEFCTNLEGCEVH
jgi:hypothetical protein